MREHQNLEEELFGDFFAGRFFFFLLLLLLLLCRGKETEDEKTKRMLRKVVSECDIGVFYLLLARHRRALTRSFALFYYELNNRIDTEGVIKRVKKIFKGHRDLILGFNQFLPRGHEIRVEDIEKEEREEANRQAQGQKPQVEFVHAISYVNKIKTRFANDERVYKTFLEILNMYRKNLKSISQVYEEVAQLFKSHNDLLEQFTYFLPDSTQQAGQGTGGRGRGGRGAGGRAARQQAGQVTQNRRKQKGGVVYDQAQQDEITEEKRAALQLAKELSYFDKVKARLRSKDQYADFCKLIGLFNADLISKMELQGLVMDVIGRFPELVTGWNEFIARCESMDFEAAEAPAAKKAAGMKLTTREVTKMKASAAREKFLSKAISELDLSTCERCGPSYRLLPKNFPKMHASTRTPLCKEVLNDNWVAVTSGSEDYSFKAMRKNQYEEALFRCEDDRMEIDMVLETNKSAIEALEKVHKEIAEMYTEEAKVIPEPAAAPVKKEEETAAAAAAGGGGDGGTNTEKPADDATAANGEAPAPAEGTEGAAKEEKKNSMDVDATKPAEAAAETPAAVTEKKSKEEVHAERLAHNLPEGTVSSVVLRAVERIYGDRGREMRFLTMNAPWATIPVVVRRLKQKSEEWQILKTEMLPIWNDVCAKNYNKSLDHRSFYFKQADKKNLSGKGMTQEIKEVSDKKKTADDTIGARMSKSPGESPDLTFEYTDRNVHDDTYAVTRFSAREIMSGEPANKVMTFYRDFLEPFFKIKRDNEDDFKDNTAERCAKVVKAAEANASPGGKKKGKKGGSKEVKKKSSEDEDADEDKEEGMEKEPDQETVDEGDEEEEEEADPDDEGVASVKKRAATPKVSNKETTAAEALEKALGLTGNDDDDDKTKDSSESDGDENSSSDSEDDQNARYKSCKPVSGNIVDGSVNSKFRYVDLPGKVFYGDEGFYHLVRLHQHLYDRLQTARTSATAMAKKTKGKKAEDIHKEFLILLFNLLNGTTDQSQFEDDCRLLLGQNSYLLFTLDKLIYKLIKQVQALLAEEIDAKLIHLAEYEAARDAPFHEGVYRANACVLLGDETPYRIGSENNGKTLQIQLCEPSLDKIDVRAGAMDGHFATHLEGFLHVAAHEDTTIVETGYKEMDEKERAPVFLRRAKKSAGFVVCSATGETDSQLSYQSAMTNVSIQNALECKISCSTSKVSYVLDTEDVFFRSHVPPGGSSAKSSAPPAKKAKKGSSKDKAVAVPQPAAKPLSRKEKLKAKSAKSKAQIEKFRAWIEKKTAEASDDDEEDEKKDAKGADKDENVKESAKSEKKDDGGHEAEPMDAA